MWNKRISRTLIAALALSLLAHVIMIAGLPGWMWPAPTSEPIEVRLVSAPPPAPIAKPLPVVKKSAPARLARRKPTAPKPPPPAAPVPAETPPVERVPADTPIPVAAAEVAPEPQAAGSVPESPVDETQSVPDEAPLPPPPNSVAIDFRILRKGGVIGTERQTYESGDGRYKLLSVAQPKGLLALALSDLTMRSEGRVTDSGLQPLHFVYQYGQNEAKAQTATFDWDAHVVRLESGSRKQEAALSAGAQDLMSFMYQFMYVPPLQEMQIAIANGKRFKVYDYVFEGEEAIDTPFGKVKCLHIRHDSNDGDEKTELWLAADYHYLPIKITKTEKDGVVLERVATALQMK